MGLDFYHTCPDIDRNIKGFKEDIDNLLRDVVTECCPLFEGEAKDDFIRGHTEYLYGLFQDYFESVRKTNEDMRKQADYQIDKLVDEVDDLRSEIKELEYRIEKLIE